MSEAIQLLDHGLVRLVDSMGSDLSIVRAARVSYDAASKAGEDEGSDSKLINFLMKHRHTTPFESVTLTFEVKAPIFVLRQWHRHRTQSYNEMSARYTQLPDEMFIPSIWSIGVQSTSNKQARTLGDVNPEDRRRIEQGLLEYEASVHASYRTYERLLNVYKFPREIARAVLPLAIYSHMFTTLNLHNLFHFLGLRQPAGAQYEIRVYADAMLELIHPIVPVAVAAWEKHQMPKET